MCNYLSIGVDAKAALLWARLALRLPWAFRLRLLNKLWYIICGSPEFALHSYRDLHARMEVTCDGQVVEIPKVGRIPPHHNHNSLAETSRHACALFK